MPLFRVVLETRMAVSGKSIIEHNEILGMDAALRFLNQTLSHVGKLTIQVPGPAAVQL